MTRMVIAAVAAVMAVSVLSGCFKGDVQVPQYGNWGKPPPPATVSAGHPDDRYDLARENQQLRERVTYVENQNRKLAKKYQELEDEMNKVRDETNRLAQQRDRYKAAAQR